MRRMGTVLSLRKHHTGYVVVTLRKKGEAKTFLVHRLVASAFIPNPLDRKQVNHKDGVKANNNAKNLEWVTQYQNMNHAARLGLGPVGERCHLAKLKEKDVLYIREVQWAISHREIAEQYGVTHGVIGAILRGKTWKYLINDKSK